MAEPTGNAAIPDDMLAQHIVAVGRTNSGKTYAIKGLVERLLAAGRRICILDPTDVWWGLRSNAAGDAPGFPVVVFGGEHADLPIDEASAVPLAKLIAERNMPAVISLADFGMGERHRFAWHFLQELHRLNRQPLHLVIDEADELAPQNPMAEARFSLHQLDRIVRRGRVRGFRVMLISQRPAVLHKNVLTQANALIAMRLPAPQDRKAIEAWITGQADLDTGRAVLASLAGLPRGIGWVWAPDIGMLERMAFPPIATFDSSRSPEDGETVQAPRTLAEVDLAGIRAALLPAGPSSQGVTALDGTAIAAAEQRGYQRGYEAGRQAALDALHDDIRDVLQRHRGAPARFIDAAPDVSTDPGVPELQIARSRPAAPPAARRRAAGDPRTPVIGTTSPLPGAAPRLLAVLAARAPARLSWSQVATLGGLKARGGHFEAGRKALRDRRLVEEASGLVAITAAGLDQAGAVTPMPTTPAEVLDMWCTRLPSPAPDMLRALRQAGPMTREELAAALNKKPRGGHWEGGLHVLRTNSLITIAGGVISLAEELRRAP